MGEASGLLSGKYTREGTQAKGEGRLPSIQPSGNPGFAKLFTERNWAIVDTLREVAKELDRSPARVALAWVTRRPGVASTLIGATRLEQLEANLHALDVEIPAPLAARLEAASRPELVHPYHFFEEDFFTGGMFTGGTKVRAEPTWFRPAPR
ncbi:aldo/keto reductase [Corallococcus llansteffanensis]|uniref:aldo/keto reductase n=1 Tax=Corallococcus llansteffanensis TaxID=2316731 RepID=UPI001FCA2A62|nr:aldo/keto reductase [Corallococcus llansteffanensis]